MYTYWQFNVKNNDDTTHQNIKNKTIKRWSSGIYPTIKWFHHTGTENTGALQAFRHSCVFSTGKLKKRVLRRILLLSLCVRRTFLRLGEVGFCFQRTSRCRRRSLTSFSTSVTLFTHSIFYSALISVARVLRLMQCRVVPARRGPPLPGVLETGSLRGDGGAVETKW